MILQWVILQLNTSYIQWLFVVRFTIIMNFNSFLRWCGEQTLTNASNSEFNTAPVFCCKIEIVRWICLNIYSVGLMFFRPSQQIHIHRFDWNGIPYLHIHTIASWCIIHPNVLHWLASIFVHFIVISLICVDSL